MPLKRELSPGGYCLTAMDHDREWEVIPEEKEAAVSTEEEPEDGDEIDWDGSEAELVADDDAAVYEDPQTGIKLNYSLRQEEVYQCLKKTGYIKTTGSRAVVETAVLAAAAVIFAVTYFTMHTVDSLVFAVISLLLIAVVWVVPEMGLRSRAKKLATGEEITMEIYPDSIVMEKAGKELEIPLDGSALSAQYGNIVVIDSDKCRVILPLRCVEPAVLPEVQAMIIAGTTPAQ